MREPEWIEHDGSKGCPVPAGHDVEVRFRNGKTSRDCCPEGWVWHHWTIKSGNVTHYRDWTAFEQNSAGEVPKLLTEADFERFIEGGMSWNEIIAELRARDLVAPEPEPVDPLRDALDDCWHMMTGPRGEAIDRLTAELRARGVTMEKNNG